MLLEAMDEDEVKNYDRALELYTEVLDFAGELIQERRNNSSSSESDEFATNIKKFLKMAYERECDLKEKQLGFDK